MRSILVAPTPFSADRRELRTANEFTLGEVARATQLPLPSLRVQVDGVDVPAEEWDDTIPPDGSDVRVLGVPAGAVIAASLLSVSAASATAIIVGGVINIAIAYGVQQLIAALNPPARPDTDSSRPGVRRTIAGGGNTSERYGPIRQVLGRHRLFPPLGAATYTTLEGGLLYQHTLLNLGYGPLAISEVKIGDEPVFREDATIVYTGIMKADADAYRGREDRKANGKGLGTYSKPDVEFEFRQGTDTDADITLFSDDVQEAHVNQLLTKQRGWVTRRTVSGTKRVEVLLVAQDGIYHQKDTGGIKTARAVFEAQYRSVTAAEDAPWTELRETGDTSPTGNKAVFDAKNRSTLFRAIRGDTTEGRFDVRVRRITNDAGSDNVVDRVTWATMLMTRIGRPVRATNQCQIAARLRVTGRFNDLSDQLNVVAQTIAVEPDGFGGWTAAKATSSPPALFRHVLQGRANNRPVADAQIDLASLHAWRDETGPLGLEFNYVTQGATTVGKMLSNITGVARASWGYQDGKIGVVLENDLSGAPVAHFTPRNTISMSSRRNYIERPHAFKVQYVDPLSGWLDDEVVVPRAPYTAVTATLFERLDQPGITSREQAGILGRYHHAVLQLRPEEYTDEVDMEYLGLNRGDWVKRMDDVILVGLGSGRVSSTTIAGGSVTHVTVDSAVPMEASTDYALRVRTSSNASVYMPIVNNPGNQTVLELVTPVATSGSHPQADDLYMFGEAGLETVDVVIKGIEPLGGMSARITCVDAAPAVRETAAVTIPAYTPRITIPPVINPKPPETPSAYKITPETEDGDSKPGSAKIGMRIRFAARSSKRSRA